MRKIFTTTGFLGLAVAALAVGNYMKVVQDTYRFGPTSQAGKAKCMLCHSTKMGPRLNAYGKDLKRAMRGSRQLTPNTLLKLDNLDSYRVGVSNGEALRQGKKPG